MMPMALLLSRPLAALSVLAVALLVLALPYQGDAKQVLILRNRSGGSNSGMDPRLKALKLLSQSVVSNPIKEQKQSYGKELQRPGAPRYVDYNSQESHSGYIDQRQVSRPRRPLRYNRRQRPTSLASSFMESMTAPFNSAADIVRSQVPEQPSFRNFMSRFRGLVLNGLGSMMPIFSP